MSNAKKTSLILLTVFLFIFSAKSLVGWLNQGTLVINTDSENTVIFLLPDDARTEKKELGTGNIKRKLWHGGYTIEVENGDEVSRAYVEIKNRQTTEKSIETKPLQDIETIGGYSVNSIISISEKIRFLNLSALILTELSIPSNNGSYYLPDLYPVNSIRWIDFEKGVVVSDGLKMLTINAGAIDSPNLLDVEVDEQYGLPSEFSVNNQGDIAYVVGKNIYFGNVFLKQYKRILEVKTENAAVSLSNSGYIYIYNSASGGGEDPYTPDEVVSLVFNVNQNKVTETNLPKSNTIESAVWNKEGNKLFTYNNSVATIFDILNNTSTKLLSIRPSNVGSFAWARENILYTDNSSVWSYSATKDTTYKVSSIGPSIDSPNIFSLSEDSAFIYFSSSPETVGYGSDGNIYRFKNQ